MHDQPSGKSSALASDLRDSVPQGSGLAVPWGYHGTTLGAV